MSQILVTGEAKIRDIQGPVIANSGVITALDGAASQYVRGDGTLADFPTSTGGGSSVSYYLNSSVSQGTIGGVAYRELSKEPIIGAGTDITISANGYVASYITDANDPDVLSVPGGNFNCEFYFSVNNNTGNPTTYAELYKYDGTTFTLLGSSVAVPESLNQGTTIAPYYFAIPVATAALALTDRLAIRIYVNVDNRTVTLHTENGHLCQVVTTFSKGMVSLNNLTDQSQFITTGTSGMDFNIVSSGDTHTFNIPVASATNTGKLSSTDWSTFNGKVPYTGATANVDLGNFNFDANNISGAAIIAKLNGPASSPFVLKSGSSGYTIGDDAISLISSPNVANTLILASNIGVVTKTAQIGLGSLTATRTFTLPDISGTLALLEGTQTFSGAKTFSGLASFTNTSGINLQYGAYINKGNTPLAFSSGTTNIYSDATTNNIVIRDNSSIAKLEFNNSTQTYTFPAASGTIALTSNIPANIVTGTGTTNTLPKFTGASTIGNSNITDTGSLITLGSNTNISSGSLGIGSSSLTGLTLRVSKNITGQFINSGGSFGVGILSDGQIQSDEVGGAAYYRATINTQAATFTAGSVSGYAVEQGTIGASSVISNQYGFVVGSTLIGATNNFGFASFIPSGTNRWNLYMNGTANNYLAGSLGIGSTSLTGYNLRIAKNITGATVSYGIFNDGTIQSDVTSAAVYYGSRATTQAATFTLTGLTHYSADQIAFGAGSTVTNQYGFLANSGLTGATNNYGFFGNIASGTNRWNLYMAGTAQNYLAGNLGIGTTNINGILNLAGTATGTFQVGAILENLGTTTGSTIRMNFLCGEDGTVGRTRAIIQSGSGVANDGYLSLQTRNAGSVTEKVRIKGTGQMRFVPLAADPTGAEAGDVYYNSTISALKLYDGTVWRTITVI